MFDEDVPSNDATPNEIFNFLGFILALIWELKMNEIIHLKLR